MQCKNKELLLLLTSGDIFKKGNNITHLACLFQINKIRRSLGQNDKYRNNNKTYERKIALLDRKTTHLSIDDSLKVKRSESE